MCSDSCHFAVIQYNDFIRLHDRWGSLWHDKYRHLICIFCNRFTQPRICRKIKCRCAVIQNQYLWIFHKCSCNGKPLFLSSWQILSVLADFRIQSFFLFLYHLQSLRRFQCSVNHLVCCIFISHFHIVANGSTKQYCFLRNNTYFLSKRLNLIVFHIFSIYQYLSFRDIIKSRDQIDQRRFPGSGSSDHTDCLSPFYNETDVWYRFFCTGIRHTDLIKDHHILFIWFLSIIFSIDNIWRQFKDFINTRCWCKRFCERYDQISQCNKR